MIDYIPLLIIGALAFHVVLMNKLAHAVQPYRIKMAAGIRDLTQSEADPKILELWHAAMKAVFFRRGQLKYGLMGYILNRKEIRAHILEIQLKVRAMPAQQRKIHDTMDRSFIILMLAQSPYTAVVVFMVALFHRGTVELANIIPNRDARGAMLLAR